MRTWPAECRVFSYGAVLPNEATNMGLMDIIFVAPAWLDGDCWRELERDGGQVFSLVSVFSMNFFFFFLFFSLFSLFLPEPLLFARVVVCVCVCVGFQSRFILDWGEKPRCSINLLFLRKWSRSFLFL